METRWQYASDSALSAGCWNEFKLRYIAELFAVNPVEFEGIGEVALRTCAINFLVGRTAFVIGDSKPWMRLQATDLRWSFLNVFGIAAMFYATNLKTCVEWREPVSGSIQSAEAPGSQPLPFPGRSRAWREQALTETREMKAEQRATMLTSKLEAVAHRV